MVMMVCICQDCSLFPSISLPLSFFLSLFISSYKTNEKVAEKWMNEVEVCLPPESASYIAIENGGTKIFFSMFAEKRKTMNIIVWILWSGDAWRSSWFVHCASEYGVCVCLGASQSSSADDICWESAKFSARKYRRLSLNLLDFMNAFAVYHSNVREVWISLRR